MSSIRKSKSYRLTGILLIWIFWNTFRSCHSSFYLNNSRVLRKDAPILSKHAIPKQEQVELDNEMNVILKLTIRLLLIIIKWILNKLKEFLKNWTLIDKNELDLTRSMRNEEEKENKTGVKDEPRVNQPVIINIDGKKSNSQETKQVNILKNTYIKYCSILSSFFMN